MIDFSFIFMFPISIIISTIAMMSGIGGAIMFSPFFLIVLQLESNLAVVCGLFIEFFGFSSGVFGYYKKKLINFKIVKKIIFFSLSGSILGVFASIYLKGYFVKIILGFILFYLSYNFLLNGKKCINKDVRCLDEKKINKKNFKNKNIKFKLINKITIFLGGFLMGISSSGLGELNEYTFLKKLKLSISDSIGTSVFLVAISALFAGIFHSFLLYNEFGFEILKKIISILVFSIPGVIIGAQIGVFLSNKIKINFMEKFIGFLFLILGIILIFTLF